jgi:hypothetical protein
MHFARMHFTKELFKPLYWDKWSIQQHPFDFFFFFAVVDLTINKNSHPPLLIFVCAHAFRLYAFNRTLSIHLFISYLFFFFWLNAENLNK